MPNKSSQINIREADLFEKTLCLELDELLNYVEGNLSPEKRYRVEKHLLNCQLCSLAVEQLPAFVNKEVIRHNVESVNAAIRERAAGESVNMQTVQKIYFLSAILGFLQRSMRYRYARFGAIIFSVLVLAGASILTFRLFQTPTYYEIPDDGNRIRSGATNFFEDFKEPASGTTPAGRYYFQAGQFAQTVQYDSVIVYLKKASELYRTEENWEMYVRCYNALAEYSRFVGNYREARQYIDNAIATGMKQLGKEHPEVARSFSVSGRIPAEP